MINKAQPFLPLNFITAIIHRIPCVSHYTVINKCSSFEPSRYAQMSYIPNYTSLTVSQSVRVSQSIGRYISSSFYIVVSLGRFSFYISHLLLY